VQDALSKGIHVADFRNFVSNYSPMFAMIAAIAGLYAMAIAIDCGLSLPV
jgi:hypothetical protein